MPNINLKLIKTMNGKELDAKYRGYFPDAETASQADTERLMNEHDSLDGTECATESYRRDDNGLQDMENPDNTRTCERDSCCD